MEYFEAILNRPHPPSLRDMPPANEQLHVNASSTPPTHQKKKKNQGYQKHESCKAAGQDGILPETLKADPETK